MITAEQQYSWAERLLSFSNATQLDKSPDWLVAARSNAKQAIVDMPTLDRKQEAWRYTSVDALLKYQFQSAFYIKDLPVLNINNYLLPDFDSYRLVFINGQYDQQQSNIRKLPDGVSVSNLRAALSTDSEQLATWFGDFGNHNKNLFTALNTALISDGVFVQIDCGVELDRPIEVIYLSQADGEPLLMQPRNLVVLDTEAKATLVERFIGVESSVYFQNSLTEISVGENASFKHYRIQDESPSAYHLSSVYLSQQEKSEYHSTTLAFGGAWSRTEYNTHFTQENGICNLNGLYTVGDQQLTDFHLDVRHSVPSCTSREQFKGVLYGKGRAVFDGHILVEKQAQHSDAQLTNDNLMLTRNAEVDTKPQLEIYADDVKCSHGTTVGQLDPQQVFYLRSRGIDENTARKMLCVGFASEILDSIEVQAVRDAATKKLNDTLNSAVESVR